MTEMLWEYRIVTGMLIALNVMGKTINSVKTLVLDSWSISRIQLNQLIRSENDQKWIPFDTNLPIHCWIYQKTLNPKIKFKNFLQVTARHVWHFSMHLFITIMTPIKLIMYLNSNHNHNNNKIIDKLYIINGIK